MKVLFIGGTGIISSAVSRLALKRGMELYHFGFSLRKTNFETSHYRGNTVD